MKKMLFTKDSESLIPLTETVNKQDHRTLILWTLDCGTIFSDIYKGYFPEDGRPKAALDIAREWSKGNVKMPVAKKAIHAVHNAASESGVPAAEAAARAVGHATATVHVRTHAMGLVYYGLTSVAYASNNNKKKINGMLETLTDRLEYWSLFDGKNELQWADFILRNDKV